MPKRLQNNFLGKRMAQSPKSLYLWELVLIKYPPERIIDIGTYRGNHSLFLLLYLLNMGKTEFYTFDPLVKWHDGVLKKILNFGQYFKQWDVFEHIEEIGAIIRRTGRSVIFCDGNEKSKEFNTFAPFLKVGDVLAVHDWINYCKPEDVKDSINKYHLCELYGKLSDEEGYLRFFIKNE